MTVEMHPFPTWIHEIFRRVLDGDLPARDLALLVVNAELTRDHRTPAESLLAAQVYLVDALLASVVRVARTPAERADAIAMLRRELEARLPLAEAARHREELEQRGKALSVAAAVKGGPDA